MGDEAEEIRKGPEGSYIMVMSRRQPRRDDMHNL